MAVAAQGLLQPADRISTRSRRGIGMMWRVMAGLVLAVVIGCGSAPGPSAASTAASAEPSGGEAPAAAVAIPASALTFASSGDAAFDAWRDAFAARAVAEGRDPRVVERLLTGLTPDPAAIRSDRSQAEIVRPWWEYVTRAVSNQRVVQGRERLAVSGPTFQAVGERYGVPAGVIAGIWGMESNFGEANLPHEAPRVLATLAYEGRRRDAFEGWLIALIEMVERGYAGPEELRSSWAGALGQPQFMPDIYLSRAVDWDGDGRRDIWNNSADVIASIANYLAEAGWRRGEPVFAEVRLPSSFDYALADGRTVRPASEWLSLGAAPVSGGGLAAEVASLPTRLYLPAGAQGPALLLFSNYDTIRAYNPADRYALSVALLGRRIEGGGGLVADWPAHLRTLTTSQVTNLQESLTALGYDAGVADGAVGVRTRAALARFQSERGLLADGFPTLVVLDSVREVAAGEPYATLGALDQAGIARLQTRLAQIGYRPGPADGVVGARTREAIAAFARSAGVVEGPELSGAPTRRMLRIADDRALY
jgi:lytic murein transglycosylase